MGKAGRTAKGILRETTETLETARFGMSLVHSDDPNQRKVGIRNIVVFGRAVTNVLQNLRSVDHEFDEWYQPVQERMKADPVMSFLYKVRTEILKQGKLNARAHMFGGFSSAALQPVTKNPPPGATAFFVGGTWGGSGWEVSLPNGDVEKYYISLDGLAGVNVKINIFFAGAPPELEGRTIQDVCQYYLDQLSGIVEEAKDRYRE